VDFKGSGKQEFVRRFIGIPNADPIFNSLKNIRDKTNIHTEITDLIVPQVGDELDDAKRLCKFVYEELGPDTPIHFLRFHPDYKMMEFDNTPIETLEKHHRVAKDIGLRYAYLGNVPGHPLEHTYCPECKSIVVGRYGFSITSWNLTEKNCCGSCGHRIPIIGKPKKTHKNRFQIIW
jgi:pyruvate formate lyase activating enzyme